MLPDSHGVPELYREGTNSTMTDIKTGHSGREAPLQRFRAKSGSRKLCKYESGSPGRSVEYRIGHRKSIKV